MKRFLSILVAFTATHAVAQEQDLSNKLKINTYLERKYSVQLFTGLNLERGGNTIGNYNINFLLSPTFQWSNKKYNHHEIGLNDLIVRSSITFTSLELSLRYEYLINFMKHKDSRLIPSLGIGATPYYNYSKTYPQVSAEFPKIYNSVGSRFFVAPRITYHFSKRLYANFSTPISFLDLSFTHQNIKDPAFPPASQRYSIMSFESNLSGTGIRLGIGFKL